MNMTLDELLRSYGWQLALVGLLGTFVVGLLKRPLHKLIYKRDTYQGITEYNPTTEKTFDVIGFLLGFVIAAILGCAYTAFAKHFGWINNIVEGEKTPVSYTFYVYLSNAFGTWLFQMLYYQAWKKLGIKTICTIIKNAVIKSITKNKEGKFNINEATAVVLGMIKNGKLSIDEVVSTVKDVVPDIAQDVVEEVTTQANELGVDVDKEDAVAKLDEITRSLLADIPESELKKFTSKLIDKASDKVKEVADKPAEVADSAKIEAPKRPTVKF